MHCFFQALYTNQIYVYKQLVYDYTSKTVFDICTDIVAVPEYADVKTTVVLVYDQDNRGMLDYKNTSISDELFHNLTQGAWLVPDKESSVNEPECFVSMARLVAGIDVAYLSWDGQDRDFVHQMPYYPSSGYCHYYNDRIYVKIDDVLVN